MPYGWNGKVLLIDLTKRKVRQQNLPSDVTEKYIGGRGFNVKYLWDNLSSKIHPFDPRNILAFGVGPLVGTSFPSSSKYNVSAISPLTGILGDSNAGGHWALQLKHAGYDQLLVVGKSKKPVYILVTDDRVVIKHADGLWGKNTWETSNEIQKENNDRFIQVASIGPAGERLVKFACIVNSDFRVAGRTGLGAVMGSKNLKAVAVRGFNQIKVYDEEALRTLVNETQELVRGGDNPSYTSWIKYGTLCLVELLSKRERLPKENWTGIANYDELQSCLEKILRDHVKGRMGCPTCPIKCGHFCSVKADDARPYGRGPEYEAFAFFGPQCGSYDVETILRANNMCNLFGLDVISTGNVICFVMELFEKGIVSKGMTEGESFEFGDSDAILRAIYNIAHRCGFGNKMAEGTAILARMIGKEAEKYAVHTAGMGWEASELRQDIGAILAHLTSTRGGDHCRGMPGLFYDPSSLKKSLELLMGASSEVILDSLKREALKVIFYENCRAVIDSMGVCRFVVKPEISANRSISVDLKHIRKAFFAVTGVQKNLRDLVRMGERIFNTERLINIRQGAMKAQDELPQKVLDPRNGKKLDPHNFNLLLDVYYDLRGWNKETGIPKRKKLESLSFSETERT